MSTWHGLPSPRGSQVMASSSSSTSPHHDPLPEPELESVSSLSSTPSLSSSSSSSNSSSLQQAKCPRSHVHFSPILKIASVVGLKSKLSSSGNDSQQKGEKDDMHTRQHSTLNDYVDELLEVTSEIGEEKRECKKGKGKEKIVENEKDELLAKATKLISRLQTSLLAQNKQGAEPTTTDLKIRIAVLKNEVKHAKRDKEAVEKSLGILVESMARVCFSSPSTTSCGCSYTTKVSTPQPQAEEKTEQESKLESLKRENRNLRAKNRELDNRLRYKEENKNEDDEFEIKSENDGEVAAAIDKKRKGKEKETSTSTASAGSWGLVDATNSDSPMSNQEHADVGLYSLEELLGGEDDDVTPTESITHTSASTSIFSNSRSLKETEVREAAPGTVQEQLTTSHASTLSLTNGPKPTILKVGFSSLGGVRGFDYSSYSEENIGRPPSYPRIGNMRTYDRFATGSSSPRLGVFDNVDERDGALNAHARLASDRRRGLGGGREKSFPEFFRYGIQYHPRENESGFLRTVHISPLPQGITLRDVLARVREGDVLSAVLVDTMSIVGGMSVRLVFKMEAAAKIFVLFAAESGISFCNNESDGGKEAEDDDREKDMKANIILIPTPTFPLPVSKSHHLTYTRCLRIPSFKSFPQTSITHTIAHLQRLLTNPNYSTMGCSDVSSFYRKEALLEIWLDECSTLHLHFSSLENAGWAWDVLSREGWKVECEDDPCAGGIEELLEPPTPRRPLIPEGFDLRDEGVVDLGSRVDAAISENERMENKVEIPIPSFSGVGIKGKNWADEVEEEEEFDSAPNKNLNPVSLSDSHQASNLSSGSTSQSHPYPISDFNLATCEHLALNTTNTINNQVHAPISPSSALDLESKALSQPIDTSPSRQANMVNTNPNTAIKSFPTSPALVYPGDNILELLIGSDDKSENELVEVAEDMEVGASSKSDENPGPRSNTDSSSNISMTRDQNAYAMLGSWARGGAEGESDSSEQQGGKGTEKHTATSTAAPAVVINPEEIDLDFELE